MPRKSASMCELSYANTTKLFIKILNKQSIKFKFAAPNFVLLVLLTTYVLWWTIKIPPNDFREKLKDENAICWPDVICIFIAWDEIFWNSPSYVILHVYLESIFYFGFRIHSQNRSGCFKIVLSERKFLFQWQYPYRVGE